MLAVGDGPSKGRRPSDLRNHRHSGL